jgi:FdhE protein
VSDAGRWDQRINRARELAGQHPAVAEILTFYAEIAAYQRSLCVGARTAFPADRDFSAAVELDGALAAVPKFLTWLKRRGSPPLVDAATRLERDAPAEWRARMQDWLARPDVDAPGVDEPTAFVVEVLVQPFAELTAIARRDRASPTDPVQAQHCPICRGRPLVGTLREAGQGAKRTLLCARCLSEWDFPRVCCPVCGEQRFDALPVYTTETFPHVRVESCDTCRRYLKTIDLTRHGLAVPLVDDLATVTLDLWARGQNYSRSRANLLRT